MIEGLAPTSGVYPLVAGAVTFTTLLVAGCSHLLHTGRLAQVLRLHGWPRRLSRTASVVLALTETTLGVVGMTGVLFGSATPLVALAAALVFSAFAVDAGHLLRSGSDAPCGCGVTDQRVSQWVVVRAMSYAFLAVAAALPRPGLLELAPPYSIATVVSATVIGLLLWLLPRTLAIPAGFAPQLLRRDRVVDGNRAGARVGGNRSPDALGRRAYATGTPAADRARNGR